MKKDDQESKETKQEKTYRFDVAKVKLEDLEGNSYREELEGKIGKPFCKSLGNGFYVNNPDFDIMPKAEQIHANKAVTFTDSEAETFKAYVKEKLPYAPFVQYAVLKQLIEEEGKKK